MDPRVRAVSRDAQPGVGGVGSGAAAAGPGEGRRGGEERWEPSPQAAVGAGAARHGAARPPGPSRGDLVAARRSEAAPSGPASAATAP